VFENFKRSLGRAGMCWSQPIQVDHMCKKRWAEGRRKILQGESLGHKRRKDSQPRLAVWHTASYSPVVPRFLQFLIFLTFFFGFMRKFEDGVGILGEWMYNTPIFLNLIPTPRRVKFSIIHGTWKFYFISFFC
jgi:hypothetical protein